MDQSEQFAQRTVHKEPEMIFPDQNSTNFPLSIKNNLMKTAEKYNKKDFLRYHQFIVYNYLIHGPSRGILLFHEMGMGKSITAVALSEYYRLHDPNRKIIVLLSKSLQQNFKKNIAKFIKTSIAKSAKEFVQEDLLNLPEDQLESRIDKIIDDKYKFVSLNASNMFTQMTNVEKTKEEIQLDKQLQEFTDVIEKDNFLDNSVLIIDEFHNLSNSITNGSYNAVRLYDTVMRTQNIKLIFLTGTPIVNSPFELVPTFNMLRGYIGITKGDQVQEIAMPLFPELQKDFYAYFVDSNTNKIKNKNIFENRIFGLISYYGNLYFGKKRQQGFPEELPLTVEKVHMSPEQFSKYDAARDLEKEEASIKGRPSRAERFSSKSSITSSYRVKSRQISNVLIPDYALTYKGKKVIKHINKISSSDLKNLNIFSPKFKKILDNIEKYKNQLGLFYSEFVSGEGIAIFAKVLDVNGYNCWNINVKLKEDVDAFDLDTPKKKSKESQKTGGSTMHARTYAIISGDVDMETRSNIVKIFNGDDNIKGEKISLLMISKTGAEGLDLKNVRHIHICEPYWNMARIDQIIARGVRYLSHDALPLKEKTVQPYLYLSDYPKEYNMKKKTAETTDIDIYTEALKNKYLIQQFYIALAEASIDCSLYEPSFSKAVKEVIKCRICSPNDKPLYHGILSTDMSIPDPCEELQSSKISVDEVDINGVKYYYMIDKNDKKKIHIFQYDDAIKGYIPLQSHEEPYSDIMRKLLKI
jgi:superfamily II DNA or RNA helicase